MKNTYKLICLFFTLLVIVSCEDLNDGVNVNPNDILVDDVEERLFLTGGMIANVQIQSGHLNRISGMYTGQLVGYSSLYSNIYGFNLSTAESNGTWNALYVGVLTNMRHIVENSTNDLLRGIAMIVEAHAVVRLLLYLATFLTLRQGIWKFQTPSSTLKFRFTTVLLLF